MYSVYVLPIQYSFSSWVDILVCVVLRTMCMFISWILTLIEKREIQSDEKEFTFVICKNFDILLSNNFQVIVFERMAKNCFKENILSNICWNILMFFNEKNNIIISNNIN